MTVAWSCCRCTILLFFHFFCSLLISTFSFFFFFFFNDTATTEIYTLSLHDALPISTPFRLDRNPSHCASPCGWRSEEHTSELQSQSNLVCRLLLEKKKKKKNDKVVAETTTGRYLYSHRRPKHAVVSHRLSLT